MLRASFVRTLFAGAAVIAASAAISVPAKAQGAPMAEFQVPFAFDAAGKAMPAGSYELVAQSPNLIALRNRTTGASILNASSGTLSQAPNARLTFVKEGNKHSLESASIMGRFGRWRVETKPPGMQIAGTNNPERIVLAAHRMANPQ